MRVYLLGLIGMMVVMITPAVAELSEQDIATLTHARHAIQAMNESVDAGTITSSQASEAINLYQKQAKSISSEYKSLSTLMAYEGPDVIVIEYELSGMQKAVGFITWTNIFYVFATVIGVGSFMALFGRWLLKLAKIFTLLPKEAYELLVYIGSIAAMANRLLFMDQWYTVYVAFTGCLMVGGAIIVSGNIHKIDFKPVRFFGFLTILWAPLAVWYGSEMIGFISVMALMFSIGFSPAMYPGCIILGFKDDDAIALGTLTAFSILALYIALTISGIATEGVLVFESGAFFMGSIVGFLGMLIMASKWYEGPNYPVMQVLAMVLGIAATYIGSVWGIGELQKAGGTFLAVYLIEKIFEIPADSVSGYACLGLIGSGVMYVMFGLIRSYPEVIQPYVYF